MHEPRQTVDYATRSTPTSTRAQLIATLLSTAEGMQFATILLRLAGGIALSLLGPLFLTVLLWALAARFRWEWMPSFSSLFWLSVLLLVPLLMSYQRRLEGTVFGNNPMESAGSYGEWEMNQQKGFWIVIAEFSLMGPAMLWSAYDAITGRAVKVGAPIVECAELIDTLIQAGEGVKIASLVRPDRSTEQLSAMLRYLEKNDWIGLSSDRRRVWVLSNRVEQVRRASERRTGRDR